MPCWFRRADIFPQHLAQLDIHPGGRLIQHQNMRVMHQRLPSNSRRRIPPDSVRA